MIIVICLVVVLGFVFMALTGQWQFAMTIWGSYAFICLLLHLLLKAKAKVVYCLTGIFFCVYTLLVLFSQIELIHDPFEDFYVHNDAAWSFYKGIMTLVLPCEWHELYDKTFGSGYFVHYPLASFLFGAIGKFGQSVGIEDIRLLFRVHTAAIGAFIIGLMASLLSGKGFTSKRIAYCLVPFSLFTFLYISSAIFSRDIHVTLVYTLAAYICLKKDVPWRLPLFVILFFAAAGFRPQNGPLLLLYPFAYYYKRLTSKIGILGVLAIMAVCIVLFVYMEDMIAFSQQSLENYDKRSLANTGGLFIRFYTLPFPLNTLFMDLYMLLMPLPLTKYLVGDGSTMLNIPFIFSPYLMFLCVSVSLYYVFRHRKTDITKYLILASLLVFTAIVYGSPDLRRAFAAVPGLYMCFCLVQEFCPRHTTLNMAKIGWSAILIINIIFLLYVTN